MENPKFISLTTPPYPIWIDGSPTGEFEEVTNIVNVNMIASIEPYVGTCLHSGWNCSLVQVNIGNTKKIYYDKRKPSELLDLIKTY